MVGNVPGLVMPDQQPKDNTVLYIPLQFWFCRNPGLALPLIALQYHEVKINLEFETLDKLLIENRQDDLQDNFPDMIQSSVEMKDAIYG